MVDPNINYNSLHKVLQNAKNKHMPSKVVKYNKYKHKTSNWITYGIIKSIYYRDNLYKKMKMTDSNSFFTNIGPTLSQKIKAPKNKTVQTYLTKTHNLNFAFHNVNEEDINQIIDKLALKTSFGFDGQSSKLMKTVKDVLIKPITIIINQMLYTGIFPDKLEIGKITPIFKQDDETLFTNYRPISLLPAISKVFE